MNSSHSPEFLYSVVKQSQLRARDPENGEFTPKAGDFSVRIPIPTFKTGYPIELEHLSNQEKRAYDLRWQMKGHPSLFFMLGRLLGCDEKEAALKMQQISLKVRYFDRLYTN
jgi:hypothetical protein